MAYLLLHGENCDVIGTYPTKQAALEVVADTVTRYGRRSPAVRELVLVRDDVPAEEGFIAQGLALATSALSRRSRAVGVKPEGERANPSTRQQDPGAVPS
jgi:hypothetical protein